ncbi:MAG: hypothetical protein GWN58_57045, partial [Anaerolineae bacterium]|nr:hypothetical protein [Anaerolineae bacterium]
KPLVAAIEVLAASAVPATGALVFKSSSPVVDAQTDPGVEPPRSALPEIGVVRLRGGTTLDLTIRNFAPEQGLVIMLSPINRSD